MAHLFASRVILLRKGGLNTTICRNFRNSISVRLGAHAHKDESHGGGDHDHHDDHHHHAPNMPPFARLKPSPDKVGWEIKKTAVVFYAIHCFVTLITVSLYLSLSLSLLFFTLFTHIFYLIIITIITNITTTLIYTPNKT